MPAPKGFIEICEVRADKTVRTWGTDLGNTPTQVWWMGDYRILKVPGFTQVNKWGVDTSLPTTYYLLHTHTVDGKLWGDLEREITPGHRWRGELYKLIKYAHTLIKIEGEKNVEVNTNSNPAGTQGAVRAVAGPGNLAAIRHAGGRGPV